MEKILISSGSDIPASFGALRTARKKTLVRIREPKAGGEVFEKSWGTLTAVPGEDYVICTDAAPDGDYPCKIDIFHQTYEETQSGSGRYRKTEVSHLVQVPAGVLALLKTKEGDIEVTHPDYVVVGKQNEVYANRPSWVEQNLDFVD